MTEQETRTKVERIEALDEKAQALAEEVRAEIPALLRDGSISTTTAYCWHERVDNAISRKENRVRVSVHHAAELLATVTPDKNEDQILDDLCEAWTEGGYGAMHFEVGDTKYKIG